MQKLKNTFAGFWKYRYLLQNLITRDFKLKYRRSVLGVVWSVLNPLLMCLVYWAVFSMRKGHSQVRRQQEKVTLNWLLEVRCSWTR